MREESAVLWQADCYLRKAQDAISRSLHELASISIKNDNRQAGFQSRSSFSRKNTIPATCTSQYDIVSFVQSLSSNDDLPECQTSLRRKRFTRRQRRYLAGGIFGERTSSRSTSALNKVLRSGSTTSSSDSGNAREQRKRSTQLTTPRRKSQSSRRVRGTTPTPASAEAAFLSLRRSYVNSSLVTRSTTEICSESTSIRPLASIELPDSFQKFKGPAARKAHRRTLRYKLNSVANNQYETKTGSQIGLNVHAANAQFNEDTLVRRSVSFRELNGRMIDFTNQDSVTRWTSQILAEIDSLPSSSFDLTGQSTLQLPAIINTTAFGTSDTITDKDLVNFKEREDDSTMGGTQNQLHSPSSNISFEIGEMNSTASASTPSNNVSEPGSLLSVDHKTQKTASKSSSIRFMKFQKRNSCRKDIWHQSMDVSEVSCTSNIVLTARPSHRSKQSAHAVVISLPKDPKISEKLHSLSPKSALSSYSPNLESHIHPKIESNSNESSRLWRFLSRKKYSSFKKYLKFQQKSVPLITVAPDTKVSGSNEATLLALINDKNHPSEYNSGPKCRINKVESDYSLPVSKTNLSFESQRRFSQMPNPDYQQFNYAVTKEMERKRNLIGTGGNGSSRSCFSMESIDVMNEEKLKFVDEKRQIEPVDQTASPLTVWKRRAKCRAREEGIFDGNVDGTKELDKNIQNPVLTAVPPVDTTASSTTDSSGNFEGVGKSVHGIVASLIRAAEETRFQALDKPKSLNLNNKTLQQNQPSTAVLTATSTSRQQETGTQTSPYSLSRSSSFDWINESSAREQHNEELITSTESPETPEDPEYSSPNRVVESDTTDKEVEEMLRSTKMRDSLLEKRKIQSSKDIDDSIAMLLEYAEDLDVVSKRGLHYPVTSENLTGFASDIRNSGSVFSREIPTDISRNKILSRNRNELLRRFVSSAGTAGFVHGLAGPHSYVTKGSSQASMNSSIYDNVPCTIQQPTGLQGSSGTVAVSADVTPTSTKLNHEVVLSRGQEVVDNCGSPNGSTISQRDISISSGLADSESSPMTPGAPAMISLHRIGRCRKQQRNADKNGSQLAQIEIESSFEMGSNESEIRSPPPPSPRSNTEKRTVSMILASDLFAFSSGRVPERAESCEELDVDFSEQASDEVYTQKKQKAEEEAIECVRWLRDAGFPQYARLYEEHRFPIDIRSVQRDHEFLDDDSLRALFRRLNALNRCAIMKVENVVLRKHPERFDINPLETDIDDDMTAINYDDDDDQVAISNKWKYQRNSRTWSRIVQDDHTTDAFNGDSSWSPRKQEVSSAEHDEALRISFGYRHNPRRQPDGAPHCSDDIYDNRNQLDPVASVIIARNDRACPTVDSSSASASAAVAVNLQRSQSERLKERARALMKRMDIRSSSRRRRQRDSSVANPALSSTTGVQHLSTPLVTASSSFAKVASSGTGRDLVIGDPVLVSHFSASPRTMRMFPDGLSNILSSQAVTPQMLEQFRRGTTTATDDHTSDGVTFAVLQPSMRQQQQQMLADCGTASQHNSCSPSARIRKRFLGVNNRRMGLVLDPSESSTVIAGDSRHKSLRRNKPRDLSCDPVLIRGMSRHDCKTRIYDRVAQDLCSDNIEYADPKCRPGDLETTSFRDRHSIAVRSERPSSSQPCYANNASFSSLIRSGLQFPSDVLSDSSPNYDELRGHPRKDMERKRDRSLALEQSYPRSKLVVNADGYYEHILSDDVHDTSLELAAFASNLDDSVIGSVTGTGTSGTALSVAAYRAVSPESSSSNTSISNHANRLKTEVDSQGRKRLAYCNGSSSFSAGRGASAQRSHSSLESSGNDDELGTRQHKSGAGERRDSGVGSSLSRSPSGPTTQRQRNSLLFTNVPTMLHIREMKTKHLSPSPLNAFRADYNETFVSDANLPHCMDALSVSEMQQIRKLAFLKLSVMIETYAGSGIRIGVVADNGSGRVSKSWAVHKFIRRMRNNETISSNNKPARTEISTFGLPLAVIQSRSGFALPRFILEMMHFLRIAAPDTVGIFRKSGVRSRITEMRLLCDVAPEAEVFTDGKLDSSQVHDIADLLKQYFRELPEPLMTAKYSETFAKIFIHIPVEMRMEALQHAVLLLPDEHREALQTLLYFLHDIAKHSATNSMTPQNLAVCFAPSLFQLCGSRLNSISPTRRHKTIGAAGLPTEREIRESRAAQECLVQMIEHCTKIFIVPSSPGFERDKGNEYCKGTELDAPFLTELGLSQDGNYKTYLLQKARELLKEHRDRWKGWIVEDTVSGVEISTKKSTDGHPLRFFRVWVDIEAPPREILTRIIRERNLWDPQIINWRTVAILNAENCDVFQYVINDTPSHPTRDATVVRLWRTDMKELRGGCVLVERSVHSSETQMLGGLPAAVLSSQFLVEPIAGRSRVTYITRTDLRGRSNVWYSKVYGQLVARKLSRLRDSFKQFTRIDDGPETKV